ncbi:MAG TPA: hypothetical protein HA222_03930 [Candidatus Diapherotrites archaeon]|uniref:Uncharacterized protein n=1 Tax=Candidatus Iainarchaeum sp. TaxID=3101447 RepID=A0A7J4K2P9_9ARCH|nr:hypothetical protein [Candidatus Diapherotrites archaeon]
MPVTKVPTKRIKREIKTLRKGLKAEKKKTAKVARKAAAKTAVLSKEMGKLKADLSNLAKKKASKKQLSEYNLFMRRQLNGGKTFNQGVKLWKAYKKGKPLVKTRVVRKTVVRRVRVPGRTKIKYRTRTVVKRVRAKPRVITKTRTIVRKVPVTRTVVKTVRIPSARAVPSAGISEHSIQAIISRELGKVREADGVKLSDEELAVRLVSLYFEEIARMGFKRQLELEDVINAYYHALGKLKGRKIESSREPIVIVKQEPVLEGKQ